MNKTSPLILLMNFLFLTSWGNPADTTIERKKYNTQRISGSITLDGIPNEEAWNAVEWGGDFTQYQPNEGKSPSQQTNFKILYDDQFLYIGYQCHDSAPDSIV